MEGVVKVFVACFIVSNTSGGQIANVQCVPVHPGNGNIAKTEEECDEPPPRLATLLDWDGITGWYCRAAWLSEKELWKW